MSKIKDMWGLVCVKRRLMLVIMTLFFLTLNFKLNYTYVYIYILDIRASKARANFLQANSSPSESALIFVPCLILVFLGPLSSLTPSSKDEKRHDCQRGTRVENALNKILSMPKK